jgi:tRNA threonylcarbamoyladenosine biosynthesis protein TsaE
MWVREATFDRLPEIAGYAADIAKEYKYLLLYGELGAGKTTLTKNIVAALGIDEIVTSPTFSIHNTYRGDDLVVLHSDLYRLGNMTELEQTGFFELLESADVMIIEWANKFGVKDMLARYAEINIIIVDENTRRYEIGVKK